MNIGKVEIAAATLWWLGWWEEREKYKYLNEIREERENINNLMK